MNALARFFALLPFAVGTAAFSIACGGSADTAGGGGGGACSGAQPSCATGCGDVGASCLDGTWSCANLPDIDCLPPGGDGGITTDASTCPDVEPDCSFTDCNGNPIYGSPQCFNGTWQCPEYAGIACFEDGGPGDDDASTGCTAPEPTCTQQGCNGQTVTTSATCSNGEWECYALPIACIEDAGPGPNDASPPVDAAPPPAPDAGACAGDGPAPVCIGRDCNGNAITFQPTCADFGWACIEPPVACPATH